MHSSMYKLCVLYNMLISISNSQWSIDTVGGERLTLLLEFFRSCGPMLECLRIGNGSPGLDRAELGARRIFGAIKVLSDNRLIGNWLPCTLRKFVPSP